MKKNYRIFVVMLLCLFTLSSISAQEIDDAKELLLSKQLDQSSSWSVDLLQAYQLYQKGETIFVDIRSKELYEKGHVPNSLNIHLPSLPQTILENPGVLPKDQPIYVICCAQDRNALWAALPLRMAGYEAYNVTGGGVDAWEYLKLPIEKGAGKAPEPKWQTELTAKEKEALLGINPSYHMMKAGRSYVYDREGIEKLFEDGREGFVMELIQTKKDKATSKYTKETSTLPDLPNSKWLKDFPKDATIFLIGKNDKELVLGVVALRMLGYDAVMLVEK